MQPEIVDADRRLRFSYDDAVRSGVDPRVLMAYHRAWMRMREEEKSDPRGAAAGYREMADDLDDE